MGLEYVRLGRGGAPRRVNGTVEQRMLQVGFGVWPKKFNQALARILSHPLIIRGEVEQSFKRLVLFLQWTVVCRTNDTQCPSVIGQFDNGLGIYNWMQNPGALGLSAWERLHLIRARANNLFGNEVEIMGCIGEIAEGRGHSAACPIVRDARLNKRIHGVSLLDLEILEEALDKANRMQLDSITGQAAHGMLNKLRLGGSLPTGAHLSEVMENAAKQEVHEVMAESVQNMVVQNVPPPPPPPPPPPYMSPPPPSQP